MRARRVRRDMAKGMTPFFRLLITTAGAGLVGNGLDTPYAFWQIGLGAILLLVAFIPQLGSFTMYHNFRNLAAHQKVAEQRPVLILPLSVVREPVPDFVEISGDLGRDLNRLAERKRRQRQAGQRMDIWSWEQALRGIEHNVRAQGPLSRLILLGSRDSVTQIHAFVTEVLERYPSLAPIRVGVFLNEPFRLLDFDILTPAYEPKDGFDFDDFEGLTAAFGTLLETLAGQGVSERDIQIDFTGGLKPTSVVAASVTFISEASNQYVATNPNDWNAETLEYNVLGYDIRKLAVRES